MGGPSYVLCSIDVFFNFDQLGDFFRPQRGFLSPYLCVVCIEALSSLLYRVERNQLMVGLRLTRKATMITHLLFADDSLIFFQEQILKIAMLF